MLPFKSLLAANALQKSHRVFTQSCGMSRTISFFDIEGRQRAWSPNTWKTRFLLNYKRLPYSTIWVRYENIADLYRQLGTGPTNTEYPHYTLPLITHEISAGQITVVADSAKIAEYIESVYPDRPLATQALLDEQKPHIEAFYKLVAGHMRAVVVPHSYKNFDEPTVSYYKNTRERMLGKTWHEWTDPANQPQLWLNMRTGLTAFAQYVNNVSNGPNSLFGISQEPVFTDFLITGYFIWLQKLGPEGGWDDMKTWNDGLWARAHRTCEPYMQIQ